MTSLSSPPLVSVIIPAWNRARFLPDALNSVFSQDYPEKEVIVVDDASTDNTKDVLKSFPGVLPFHMKVHHGQCTARNVGLNSATGKYILMLDSDDALSPGVIARHAAFLEANPDIDLVYGDMMLSNTYIMSNPQVKGSFEFHPDIRPGTPIDFDMKQTLIENLDKPCNPRQSILNLFTPDLKPLGISTGTALFRKNSVRYDPVIEERWNCSADVDFWGQLIMAGFHFAYLPGLALECRVHGQNITNQAPLGTRGRFGVRKYIYKKLKHQVLESLT